MPLKDATATVTPSFPTWIELTLAKFKSTAQALADDRDSRPHIVPSHVFLLFGTPLELSVLAVMRRDRQGSISTLMTYFQDRLRVHGAAVLGLGLHDRKAFQEIQGQYADLRLLGSLDYSALPRHAPVAQIGLNMRWLSEDEGWP